MAGKNNGNGGSATLSPLQNVRQAEEAVVQARATAISDFEAQRDALVAQFLEIADRIVETDTGLEGLGVDSYPMIDVSHLGYCLVGSSSPRGRRRSTGGGGGEGPRGSKPCTLPDGILIAMDQSERGTEFNIAEVCDAVQQKPVNYPFSGDEDNISVAVSQNLGKLVKSGHISRQGRGIYILTAAGAKAANVALESMRS